VPDRPAGDHHGHAIAGSTHLCRGHGVILEALAAASVAIAGTIGLVLWVDARCALDAAGLRTLCAVVLATVAAGAFALRLTALNFPLGSVAAALLGLGGWTVVVLLTTRPRPAVIPLPAGDE
jgi:hypothetical protein